MEFKVCSNPSFYLHRVARVGLTISSSDALPQGSKALVKGVLCICPRNEIHSRTRWQVSMCGRCFLNDKGAYQFPMPLSHSRVTQALNEWNERLEFFNLLFHLFCYFKYSCTNKYFICNSIGNNRATYRSSVSRSKY